MVVDADIIAVGKAFTVMLIDVPTAHVVGVPIDVGVKVYVCIPTALVEIVGGNHVPEIPLVEVVGKTAGVAT